MNTRIIKETIRLLGADVCGIANINSFRDAPEGFHPRDILQKAKSVVVFGKQFPRGTFQSKSHAPYTLVRNQLIQQVDCIASEVSCEIENEGFLAVPVPSSEPYEYWDPQRKHGRGILSLKHSAQLAGVGSMGKNTLLINEKFGNRLWLGGIITEAELDPDCPTKSFCPPKCRVCLDACPQSALNGTTIEQEKCREICFTSTEGGGWLIACNICRVKCPFANI